MTVRKSTEERRREIADAAIQIIGERGLREFTAAQIAERVGIRDATIFRHFKDMNAITLAVLDRLEEWVELIPPLNGGPLERLEGFLRMRLRAVSLQPGIQSILFSDQISHALNSEGPRRVAAIRNRGREFIRSCLREGAERGLLREDLDIEAAVVIITGLAMGFLFASKDGALPAPPDEIERRCLQTMRVLIEREAEKS